MKTECMKRLVSLTALMVLIGSSIGGSLYGAPLPDCDNFIGNWRNELNSTLRVTKIDKETRLVSGCYCSPEGTEGQWFRLTGWAGFNPTEDKEDPSEVETLVWAVFFTEANSITTWSGECTEKNKVSTLDTLYYLVSAEAPISFEHRFAGADTFQPVSHPNPKCDKLPKYCQLPSSSD